VYMEKNETRISAFCGFLGFLDFCLNIIERGDAISFISLVLWYYIHIMFIVFVCRFTSFCDGFWNDIYFVI